jgi:hypothetical protein
MTYRRSLHHLLHQLYRRRADIENLICFFEDYGRMAARRRGRAKRPLRWAA